MKTDQELCPNCKATLDGKYCSSCGQKKIEAKEKTLRHFVFQFFGAAFFLENNVIKNVWYLISRPGFLAVEYLRGRRKSHMAPISIFLLINLIFFFATNLTDLNLSLTDQTYQPQHAKLANKLVEKRMADREISFDEYEEKYNQQSTILSKSLVVLHAPVMAIFLMLLYWRKKYFYVEHLVFTLYFMAFVLLFVSIVTSLGILLVRWDVIRSRSVFQIFGYLQLVGILAYLFLALKRFYKQKYVWLVPQTLAVLILFAVSHFIYRTLLFFIVFATT